MSQQFSLGIFWLHPMRDELLTLIGPTRPGSLRCAIYGHARPQSVRHLCKFSSSSVIVLKAFCPSPQALPSEKRAALQSPRCCIVCLCVSQMTTVLDSTLGLSQNPNCKHPEEEPVISRNSHVGYVRSFVSFWQQRQ